MRLKYFGLLCLGVIGLSSQAMAIDISQNDITNFLKNHVSVARSCNAQAVQTHITQDLTPDYIMQTINQDGSRSNTSRAQLLQQYVSLLSDATFVAEIRPLCQSYKMALGKVDIKSDSATFITVETFDGAKTVCKHTGIKNGTKFMVKNSLCQDQ